MAALILQVPLSAFAGEIPSKVFDRPSLTPQGSSQRAPQPPDPNRIYLPTQQLSFGDWNQVPGSGTTLLADATTVYHNKLYVFGIGIKDQAHYVNTFDGSRWSGWSQVPGGGTTAIPDAAVVFRDRLYLFAVGIKDHAHYANTFDGSRWSGWSQVAGGGTTATSDAAVVFRDRLYLFAIGIKDQAHYVNMFDGTRWSGWTEVPGGGTTAAPDAAVVFRDRLYLFAVGIKDHGHYANTFDGSRWSGWSQVPGGGSTATPDAAVVFRDRLYLFAVGIKDQAHYANMFDGSRWSGWSRVPGGATSATPAAAASYGENLFLFTIDSIDHRHYVNVASANLASGLPRYNEVFRKATHNSYWVDGAADRADAFAAGPQQRVLDQALFEHTRAFEFDIHYRAYHPGEFDVYHTDNQDNSTCYSLEDCLELMRRIDYVLPNHEPINFIIELKEAVGSLWGNSGCPVCYQDHHPSDLDRVLWERLGSRIYTPREFLERCPAGYTLRDCARDYGWPTVDELRGRYIINVIGNDGPGSFLNDQSYKTYTDDDGGVTNRAAFPLRSVLENNADNPASCAGACATRRANEVFWQVESLGKPDVPQFVADGGMVRSKAAHIVMDPVPVGNPDNVGSISQQWAISQGYQMLMTDYPWNFIEDKWRAAPGVPSRVDQPFFERADVDPKAARSWDASLLSEPGGRILFNTAPRFIEFDRLSDSAGTLENDPGKTGYAEAFIDAQRAFPNAIWEVFPSTTADSHSAGPRNNGRPGEGCFFARSADGQSELRVCRIAQMNGGRDITVHTRIKEQGVVTYDDWTNVHKNVVTGTGDAFRIVLSLQPRGTRVSLMTGNAVLPDGTMGWIQHPVNGARGNGATFFVNGVLSQQGLAANNEVLFVGTTLNGQPLRLAQLTTNGGRITDLSSCLDGSCRRYLRPSHETERRAGGTVWVGVHETEGRVFQQWRTLYTTNRFEVATSGLGQYPVYEKFELANSGGGSFVPLYRCVDWRRDYHQYWLSTDGTCPNPNTREAFAQSAGIIGYISTQQLPGMQPLWHLRKGTYNAGTADTHDHYFAVGDGERDVKLSREGYGLVGRSPIGYVYTPATLP